MSIGLIGFGSERGWRVSVYAIESRDLYGIAIQGGQCLLQAGDLAFARLKELEGFLCLNADEDGTFPLQDAFGGKLEFVQDEGRLRLRASQNGRNDFSNLLKVSLCPEDRAALAVALKQAIQDAES